MIAALASNGVIGRGNALPWRLPADLRYFKRMTLGKPVLMGRRTWESIGRPLPGRTNIVLSRGGAACPGAQVVASPEEALALARAEGAPELMVIGGEAVYRALLGRAQRLYLTEVHAPFEGDAHFPVIERGSWREVARQRHPATADNPWDHSYVVLERRVDAAGGAVE